jgi:hypothetical protein
VSEPVFYSCATLGFRQWHLSLDEVEGGAFLEGLLKYGFRHPHHRWDLEGPNRAECLRARTSPRSVPEGHGEVPGIGCSCGFYATPAGKVPTATPRFLGPAASWPGGGPSSFTRGGSGARWPRCWPDEKGRPPELLGPRPPTAPVGCGASRRGQSSWGGRNPWVPPYPVGGSPMTGGGRGWQGPEARLLLSRLGPPFPQNEDGHTSPPTNSIYRSPRAPKIGTPYIIAIWGSSSGPWTVKVAQQRERQLSRPPQKVRLRRVRDAVRQRTGLARVRRPLGQVRDLVPGQCLVHRIGARRCDRRP